MSEEFNDDVQANEPTEISPPGDVQYLPERVFVIQDEKGFPVLVDADRLTAVEPVDGGQYKIEFASAGGKTKVIIKYDDVEVR